jgi:elongation factor G
MSKHGTAGIRNISLIGGPGTGKTSLAEAILHETGVIDRLGSVADGNTVSDHDDDEREKQHSLRMSYLRIDHKGCDYHFMDAPGYPDFVGEASCAIAGAEATLLCVNAAHGLTFPSIKSWNLAGTMGAARGIVVTHIDQVEFDVDEMVAQLSETLGKRCIPVTIPDGSGASLKGVSRVPFGADKGLEAERAALLEAIVEVDEDAMMKFLEEDVLPADDEARSLLRRSIVQGEVVPVAFVSCLDGKGVPELLHFAKDALPSPEDGPYYKDSDGEPVKPGGDATIAFVVNVIIDPFVGKLCMLRVVSGKISSGDSLKLMRTGKQEKLAHLQVMQGKDHTEVRDATAGDIVAVAKLDDLEISDTLVSAGECTIAPVAVPVPMAARAIELTNHADEIKLSESLRRAASEDPAFSFERDENTGELVIHGTSIVHLETTLRRIRARSGVEVEVKVPRVALKETVRSSAEGHHRHKKQTGGRGQFAEVYLSVEPSERGSGLVFEDATVGGSVPKNFIPAIEKGVREVMASGIIAGYTVVDVKVSVKDGKYHDVDSDEASFKMAGGRAFKDGFMKARPVLLEPLLDVEVAVPSRFMGAITSDITGRRGQISGMDALGDIQVVQARVPQREVLTYPTVLHSLTSGEGSFTSVFHDYEVVPANIPQELMAEYQPRE